MLSAKRLFKRNTDNKIFKALAGFGRSLHRTYENRNHDIYSNGELTVLRKIGSLQPSIIIDGGANIGKYAKILNESCPSAQIHAFEPVGSTFKILNENVKGMDKVSTYMKGLYKENCSKEINIYNSNTHSSVYDIKGLSQKPKNTETIELIKGDDFLREHKIDQVDLLKIDVEGAEYDALLGFEKHLEEGKIKIVQFEYGYINITTRKLLLDYYQFFESKGYVLGKIFPKAVKFREYKFKHEDFIGPNFIAVKNTETELIELLKKK